MINEIVIFFSRQKWSCVPHWACPYDHVPFFWRMHSGTVQYGYLNWRSFCSIDIRPKRTLVLSTRAPVSAISLASREFSSTNHLSTPWFDTIFISTSGVLPDCFKRSCSTSSGIYGFSRCNRVWKSPGISYGMGCSTTSLILPYASFLQSRIGFEFSSDHVSLVNFEAGVETASWAVRMLCSAEFIASSTNLEESVEVEVGGGMLFLMR